MAEGSATWPYTGAMRLQSLKALVAIAEHGSFSNAALELGLSQSSVSHAIAELEDELGVKLLERGRHGATTTAVGERVVAHARRIERGADAILQEASCEHGELQGTVRVASFRSLAKHVLAPVLTVLRSSHPGLVVEVEALSSQWSDASAAMLATRADLLLTLESVAGEAIFWKLIHDPYVAVVPSSWQGGDVGVLGDLVDRPLILNDGPCSWPMRERLLELDPSVRPEFEISEDSTMVALAAQGLGIALMPELTVDAVPHGARVIGLEERIERVIGVAVQPGALKIPAVRVFLDAVRGLFPESAVPALSTMWGRTAEVGRSVTTLT